MTRQLKADVDAKWVKGIRAWVKKTFSPRTYHDTQDVISHLTQLREHDLERLYQYLFYTKGLLPLGDKAMASLQEKLRRKIAEELKEASELLSEAVHTIQFELDAITPGTNAYKHRPDVREFYERVPVSPEKATFESVKERATKVLEQVDGVLSGKVLRAISAFVAKYSPASGVFTPELLLEYNLGNAKLVYDGKPDPSLISPPEARDVRDLSDYIPYLQKAKALLDQKRLGFLWYGPIFVGCPSCGGENQYGKQFGVGAHYVIHQDHVVVFTEPRSYLTELMIHELAHRYWFRFMDQGDRLRFSSYFGEVAAVSEYGSKASEEDFAEVFAHFVTGKDMTRDQIDRFKAFLAKKDRGKFAALDVESYGNGISKKAYDPTTGGVQLALRDFQGAVKSFYALLQPTESPWLRSYDIHNTWNRVVTLGEIVAQWVLMTRDIHGRERAVAQAIKAMRITRTKDIPGWIKKNTGVLKLLVDALSWKERDKENNPGVFKIAPFIVHDAVGLSAAQRKAVQALIEVASRELKSSKFSQVLYGDIQIVGNISKSNTLAWYNFKEDDVFIRPETKFGPANVRSLIHELGHRFWFKFTTSSVQGTWNRHYENLRYSSGAVQMPKPGEVLDLAITGKKEPSVVKEITYDKVILTNGYYIPLKKLRELLQARASFPTVYSSTSPAEYFADAFALYVLGKLDSPFKEHFERIVLEGGPAKEEISLSKSARRVALRYLVQES